MTKAEVTRLKNLRLRKARGKYPLTPADLTVLKNLANKERHHLRAELKASGNISL